LFASLGGRLEKSEKSRSSGCPGFPPWERSDYPAGFCIQRLRQCAENKRAAICPTFEQTRIYMIINELQIAKGSRQAVPFGPEERVPARGQNSPTCRSALTFWPFSPTASVRLTLSAGPFRPDPFGRPFRPTLSADPFGRTLSADPSASFGLVGWRTPALPWAVLVIERPLIASRN